MLVTTAGRTNAEMKNKALAIAAELELDFFERKKASIQEIQEKTGDDLLVVGKNRLELHSVSSKEPLFFHPNSAMFRIKRLIAGDADPLVESAGIKNGSSVLDCTLGLASDSITASFAAGETGRVVGVEGSRFIAYLTRDGLQSWDSGLEAMNEAMKRIEVVNGDAMEYLKASGDNSFDIVYFDPMFTDSIEESDGLRGLKNFAIYKNLTQEMVEEASRVARTRVVLKDHWQSSRFEKLGFTPIKRKTSKFHFGIFDAGLTE